MLTRFLIVNFEAEDAFNRLWFELVAGINANKNNFELGCDYWEIKFITWICSKTSDGPQQSFEDKEIAFLENIITDTEKWVLYNNPGHKQQILVIDTKDSSSVYLIGWYRLF